MESPSKSEVIDRCGGDEKNRKITQNRQKSYAKKIKKNKKKYVNRIFNTQYSDINSYM